MIFIIFFLDEPSVGNAGFDYISLWKELFTDFGSIKTGIHTCGTMDWDRLFKSGIDYISFDASKYDITGYPMYNLRKRISWGIETIQDVKDFKAGDIITPPCGLATFSEDQCKKVLSNLQKIANIFQQ